MYFQALKDLLGRYRRVIGAAWAFRDKWTPVPRTRDELSFLPAALEIQETPPHPAARLTLLALMGFFVIALAWAIIGELDVVAVAPGKLIVSDRSKVIQSLDPGVVKAIHVRDGQLVQAGQTLIELDATIAGADNDKARAALLEARLDVLRAQALLVALDARAIPKFAEGQADRDLPPP